MIQIVILKNLIVSPKTFQYFHVFPLRSNDFKIIFPPKPYLALEENEFQYISQLLEKSKIS